MLALDVRIDGFDDPVGDLVRGDGGGLTFTYDARYLSHADAMPLSLSLPLTDDAYGDVVTRAFFDNLLQERDGGLAETMAREGIARDDVAGLLFHLGKDCPGALSVLPRGAPPAKVPGDYDRDYQALSAETLEAIVVSLHERRRPPEGMQDPSPLAGVQGKIALTLLPDGRLAEPLPGSGAPTTHILKVPDREHPLDARLEAAAMDLSRALGFETADAVVTAIAGIDALLVTRFDRGRDREGRIARIHQEDFAQALGLPAALKYERRGTEGRRFDAAAIRRVLDATDNPAGAKEVFIRATLFDLMIGNADGHAKNFALLHGRGRRARLAPRYDLLPTRLDDSLTDELAFTIGAARTAEEVSAEAFDAFLETLGIASPAARRRITARSAGDVAGGLAARLAELDRRGMKRFADLIAANVRQLLDAFGIATPEQARGRDAFIASAGGWLLS